MNLGIGGKVILVTGGASGIGAAVVRGCCEEGSTPVILDRNEVSIESLRLELSRNGFRVEAIAVELTDIPDIQRAVGVVSGKFGRIDGVVNNAGTNDGVGLVDGNSGAFRESLRRNVIHSYAVAHFALPALKRERGAIVNIGSKVAVTGQGGTSGYAAAKGAILELTGDWARELTPSGIRVNAVVPAEVLTPQYQTWAAQFGDPDEVLRNVAAKIPLHRRMTHSDEIASMVLFLLSEQAAGVNGQVVFVDGGYVHLDRRLT